MCVVSLAEKSEDNVVSYVSDLQPEKTWRHRSFPLGDFLLIEFFIKSNEIKNSIDLTYIVFFSKIVYTKSKPIDLFMSQALHHVSRNC